MKPIPAELATQLDRVREHVDDDELAALLERMADRYDVAGIRVESGEATIRMRLHRGKHSEFRWNADESVKPRSKGPRLQG